MGVERGFAPSQRPLWGLGQRPNCFSGAQFKETAHKGAGSEASLPVTSRFLRSAPQAALSNTYAVSRQMGATV